MADGKRIEIKVPDIYRQTEAGVWDELEIYLYRSFLTASALIADIHFIFKTINHHEIANIELHRPIRGSSEEVQRRYQSTLIAYSVFMLDGSNVLPDRSRYLPRLIKTFEKMDPTIIGIIVKHISLLNRRANFLFPLTEVYVHENRSRFKWLHTRQTSINSPVVTGIPGTDLLGMNYCQQTWTTLNQLQDVKDEIERDWNNSKFVGSCFNGKGVRPIEEKDRGRREKERQDQEDLKMKVLFRYLNRDEYGRSIEPDDTMTLPDGRKVTVEKRTSAQTVDELALELSASLSGEKDAHDIIIEKALLQMQQKREQLDREKVNLYKATPLEESDSVSDVLTGGRQEADMRVARLRAIQQDQVRKSVVHLHPDLNDGSSIEPKR